MALAAVDCLALIDVRIPADRIPFFRREAWAHTRSVSYLSLHGWTTDLSLPPLRWAATQSFSTAARAPNSSTTAQTHPSLGLSMKQYSNFIPGASKFLQHACLFLFLPDQTCSRARAQTLHCVTVCTSVPPTIFCPNARTTPRYITIRTSYSTGRSNTWLIRAITLSAAVISTQSGLTQRRGEGATNPYS